MALIGKAEFRFAIQEFEKPGQATAAPLAWIIHEQGGKGKLGVFRTL
jgi:hypothetical protein